MLPIRRGPAGAVRLCAVGIQAQGVVCDGEPFRLCNGILAILDFPVVKLLHLSAVQTDQVVVMLSFVKLVYRLSTFKVTAAENARLLKLGQHPIDRCKSYIRAFLQQQAKDIFGGQMPLQAALKNFKDFQTRNGCLESGAFQFVDVGHELFYAGNRWGAAATITRSYPA